MSWARYRGRQERLRLKQLGRDFMIRHAEKLEKTNAAIFEIHQMMLEDDDYNESVENIITYPAGKC